MKVSSWENHLFLWAMASMPDADFLAPKVGVRSPENRRTRRLDAGFLVGG